ncbi:MAG: hypothetical protein IJF90_04980 [Synergistaceae bacterium]|nr:hypothetical protein [Synergistaceae bacterium]
MLTMLLWLIPIGVISWWLGPKKVLAILSAIWRSFKRLAGWIGTIPAMIAGIHLWGNDTFFQKFVKGIVSTIGALLSWVTGYRKGYEQGYRDAQAKKSKRWWKVLWPF